MMPSPEYIADLILKELRNEINALEKIELDAWRAKSANHEATYQELSNEQTFLSLLKERDDSRNRIWRKLVNMAPELQSELFQPPVKKIGSSKPWMLAAAVILLAITGFLAYRLLLYKSSGQKDDSDTLQTALIQPGGAHATLQLSDGTTIVLDTMYTGIFQQQYSSIVEKLDSGTLRYRESKAIAGNNGFNTLSVPHGGRYEVILPDGTKVWLNAASSLKYPAQFEGKERKVWLTGEGYFEVAKNPAQPFITIVNDILPVTVLGTHFNVMAYTDEPGIETTLLEGKVQMGNTVLSPNELGLQVKGGVITVTKLDDAETVIAWKNGYIDFSNDDIFTIMRRIARWYDVTVSYQGTIPERRFKGGIPANSSLDDVLQVLALNGIKFKQDGRKITVTP